MHFLTFLGVNYQYSLENIQKCPDKLEMADSSRKNWNAIRFYCVNIDFCTLQASRSSFIYLFISYFPCNQLYLKLYTR